MVLSFFWFLFFGNFNCRWVGIIIDAHQCFDRWFVNREKTLKEKYGEGDTEIGDMICDTFFEINEMLGFKSDPKNLKRFLYMTLLI
jgi:hypothetical protein